VRYPVRPPSPNGGSVAEERLVAAVVVGGSGLSTGPLRGRDLELGVLEARVQALADGQGGVVLVDGPAGIGKTWIIDEALGVARDRGIAVALASADEERKLVPLAGFSRALGLRPSLRPDGVIDTQHWLIEQLRSQLVERAARSPLLLALDDLHYADEVTLLALERLTAQLASYALLWVLAGRRGAGGPLDRVFSRVEAVGGTFPIRLRPLPPITGGELPPTEHALRTHALGQLLPGALQLLEVAAALGRSFSADDVAEVLGEPVGQLLEPLQEVLEIGVVVTTADGFAFRHPSDREAVYARIAEPVRVALHRQIGRILLDRGGSAVPAVPHLVKGTRPGDHEFLAGLDEAIRELMPSSPKAAADLARLALELTDPTEADHLSRAVTAIDALVASRRLSEATTLGRPILRAPGLPPVPKARLRLTMSSILFVDAHTAEALTEAESVLAVGGLPDELYTAAELARLRGLMAQDDWSRVRASAETILAGDHRSGADAALAGALAALGLVAWNEGRVADSLGLLRAAVQRADSGPPEARSNYPRLGLANMLTAIGELEESEIVIRQCRDEIELLGDTLWTAAPTIAASRLHLAAGRLDDASAEAEVGLAIAEQMATPFFVPLARSTLAVVSVLRGDLRAAAQHVRAYQGLLLAEREGALGSEACAFSDAWLAEAEDGPARAVERLADVYDDLPSNRLLLDESGAAAWLTRLALAVDDRERAARVVACSQRLAENNPDFAAVGAAAAHARGLLDRDGAALQQAAADHPYPWLRASALEDAAVVLAEAGDRSEARVHLARALVAYDRFGAERDAARVRARLRELGVGHRHRPRADRPMSGWASLTETEGNVAGLVAEGLTNREVAQRLYLSRHTVDFHLRQIFRKLEVGSRVALTRLAFEHGTSG
jgi:DNA-binding CsgD family transcriptional regulator